MALKEDLWNVIAGVVEGAGFSVFDIEPPSSGGGGILRVLITKASGGGVILDECAMVSKRLEEVAALDEIISGSYILEVSSPGINRKLTRPEHYRTAVGERVKVVTEKVGEEQNVFRGKLLECDGHTLRIDDEEQKATVSVAMSTVRKARVDFKF